MKNVHEIYQILLVVRMDLMQPVSSLASKEWHHRINSEIKKKIVHRSISILFPALDQSHIKDPRLSSLIGYLIQIEFEIYVQARDEEAYFHLMAERIFKLKKQYSEFSLIRKIGSTDNVSRDQMTHKPVRRKKIMKSFH